MPKNADSGDPAHLLALNKPEGMDGDEKLEPRLYGAVGVKRGHLKLPEPDWPAVPRELKRKHVTPQVLMDKFAHGQVGRAIPRWAC